MLSLPTLPHARSIAAALAGGAVALTVFATRQPLPLALPKLPLLSIVPSSAAVAKFAAELDPGVVLFFVPACALILAIVAEALWLVFHGASPVDVAPNAGPAIQWPDSAD